MTKYEAAVFGFVSARTNVEVLPRKDINKVIPTLLIGNVLLRKALRLDGVFVCYINGQSLSTDAAPRQDDCEWSTQVQ